jgi:hypothetical protein
MSVWKDINYTYVYLPEQDTQCYIPEDMIQGTKIRIQLRWFMYAVTDTVLWPAE